MELQEIINIVKDISWPAASLTSVVVFLRSPIGVAIGEYLRSKIPGNAFTSKHESDLSIIKADTRTIRSNHLHEVIDALNRIEAKLDKMNDNIIYIKSRINGNS